MFFYSHGGNKMNSVFFAVSYYYFYFIYDKVKVIYAAKNATLV